jgi:mono/diheme cytochrome c family protein
VKRWWWITILLFSCQPSLNRQPKWNALEGGKRLPFGVVPFRSVPPKLSLERGRALYEIHCAVCHGISGNGKTVLAARGFASPGLLSPGPDEEAVRTILEGKGRMYGFQDRLEANEARAVVAYLHALRLSQNARFRDLPREDQARLEAE